MGGGSVGSTELIGLRGIASGVVGILPATISPSAPLS